MILQYEMRTSIHLLLLLSAAVSAKNERKELILLPLEESPTYTAPARPQSRPIERLLAYSRALGGNSIGYLDRLKDRLNRRPTGFYTRNAPKYAPK